MIKKDKNMKDNEIVFANFEGDYSDANYLNNRYAKILKDAGLEYRGFHPIRHSFATRLYEAGVDDGTPNITETQRYIYNHEYLYKHLKETSI